MKRILLRKKNKRGVKKNNTNSCAPSSKNKGYSEPIEKIRDLVERGGVQISAIFISYILILVYFLVEVLVTDDIAILNLSGKRIPILGIDIPFRIFFGFGPWVVVLVHLNLFIHYYYLSNNVIYFDQIVNRDKNTNVGIVHNFFLSSLILDKKMPRMLRPMMLASFFSLSVALPVLVLMLFIINSKHLREIGLLVSQVWALLVDLVIIMPIWNFVYSKITFFTRKYGIRWALQLVFKSVLMPLKFANLAFILFLSFWLLFVYVVPEDGFRCGKLTVSVDRFSILNALNDALTLNDQVCVKGEPPIELICKFIDDYKNYNKTKFMLIRALKLGIVLDQRNLQKANFDFSKFPFASLKYADLRSSTLQHTNFVGSTFLNTIFDGSNMSEANFKYSDFGGAIYKTTEGYKIYGNSTFSGATLWRANMSLTNLCGSVFDGADLQEANLKCSDLRGAQFNGVDLRLAHLHGADLRDALFVGSDLAGANFEGANLSNTVFISCNVESANFIGAVFDPKEINLCNFKNAVFSSMNEEDFVKFANKLISQIDDQEYHDIAKEVLKDFHNASLNLHPKTVPIDTCFDKSLITNSWGWINPSCLGDFTSDFNYKLGKIYRNLVCNNPEIAKQVETRLSIKPDINPEFITSFLEGDCFSFATDHAYFERIKTIIKEKNLDQDVKESYHKKSILQHFLR